MTNVGIMPSAASGSASRAMLTKEFIQLRRDRISFGMIIMIPLMQLVLFGFAINTTPRHLPTAVLLQETSDVGRAILAAFRTRNISRSRLSSRERRVRPRACVRKGAVRDRIPANFERALRRGDKPALLVAADATDPVAAGTALGSLGRSSRLR